MPIASLLAYPAVHLLLWGIVALGACAAILRALLSSGLAWRLATDIPNDRSLHTRPTPRVGGWGIVPAAVLLIWLVAPALWLPALAAALLAAVSTTGAACPPACVSALMRRRWRR